MTTDTSGLVRLGDLAFARSGDKGDDANVGVWTHEPTTYAHLRQVLTAERVAAHVSALHPSGVTRYELPHLLAFNFVLHDALDGGGAVSLRTDAQGKTLSLALLELRVEAPPRDAPPPGAAPGADTDRHSHADPGTD